MRESNYKDIRRAVKGNMDQGTVFKKRNLERRFPLHGLGSDLTQTSDCSPLGEGISYG